MKGQSWQVSASYYYTIKADNPYSKPDDVFVETKKMILLKQKSM